MSDNPSLAGIGPLGNIPILDHGFIRFIEDWGHGECGQPEAGIIEAARQSTQGSFRGWEDTDCPVKDFHTDGKCATCEGRGYMPGDARLLRFLKRMRHDTPFEFAGMTIEVRAPVFVFREWHRHRTQSFNELSARYAQMPNLNYVPALERVMLNGGKNKQAGALKGSRTLNELNAEAWRGALEDNYQDAEQLYQEGLNLGIPKELARLCVPVGRYSQMRASANLRNWLGFITLRSDPAAQWEIRQFSNVVGQLVSQRFPQTWKIFKELCDVEG